MALKISEKSGDTELAAKCIFLIAKCDIHTMETHFDKNGPDEEGKAAYGDYHHLLAALKTRYYDTQFYKEILKECKYFRTFAEKN